MGIKYYLRIQGITSGNKLGLWWHLRASRMPRHNLNQWWSSKLMHKAWPDFLEVITQCEGAKRSLLYHLVLIAYNSCGWISPIVRQYWCYAFCGFLKCFVTPDIDEYANYTRMFSDGVLLSFSCIKLSRCINISGCDRFRKFNWVYLCND